MPSPTDFPAPGKIISAIDGQIIFAPRGTSYRLHLKSEGPFAGPLETPVEALIRVRARKVYTVPSGGNFVSPIVGPPRTIQGRVRYMDERQLVVTAGANFLIELPGGDEAVDLNNGHIAINTMVNVMAWPGAAIEVLARRQPSTSPGVANVGAGAGQV